MSWRISKAARIHAEALLLLIRALRQVAHYAFGIHWCPAAAVELETANWIFQRKGERTLRLQSYLKQCLTLIEFQINISLPILVLP
jgi:hypothetical protein